MSIGVIETWECTLALCADEAVGSLERGGKSRLSINQRPFREKSPEGTDGRTLTIWLDPVPIKSVPDPNVIGTKETNMGFGCCSRIGRGGSGGGRRATTEGGGGIR